MRQLWPTLWYRTATWRDTLGPIRDQYNNYKLRIGKEAVGDIPTVQEVKFSLSTPWEQSDGVKLIFNLSTKQK
jgi:hypothetical protein